MDTTAPVCASRSGPTGNDVRSMELVASQGRVSTLVSEFSTEFSTRTLALDNLGSPCYAGP